MCVGGVGFKLTFLCCLKSKWGDHFAYFNTLPILVLTDTYQVKYTHIYLMGSMIILNLL